MVKIEAGSVGFGTGTYRGPASREAAIGRPCRQTVVRLNMRASRPIGRNGLVQLRFDWCELAPRCAAQSGGCGHVDDNFDIFGAFLERIRLFLGGPTVG